MALLLIVLLPFAGALLPLWQARRRDHCAIAAALAPLLALAVLLGCTGQVLDGHVVFFSTPWLPTLGLDLSLRLDGLGLLFALLILGIGLLVILYARYYLHERAALARLYAQLLLFMGSMLGLVLASNLLLLAIFWELTGLVSFLLIGFWSRDGHARRGARMALAVTGAGGLALLAGILLIGQIVGSFDLGAVLAAGTIIRGDPLYPLVLTLVLLGAFSKSAQFPFQFWLPRAMAAPTPVSAYLHSATLVKAGVFLLARLYPALAGSELWFYAVGTIGLITLLFGATVALFQHDLKGLLAFSTISHLGLITLLFGFNTPAAAVAAVFHIINHAIFKASLFMAAGIIDHETGTRDMRRVAGLWHYMPHTALLAMVAAAAMAGVPLFNGFLSKEMFFSETLALHYLGVQGYMVPLIAALAGIFSVAYSLRFIHDVFFNGQPINLPKFPPHEPPRYMKLPVEILALFCLLVGIAPGFTIAPLLEVAATATLGRPVPVYNLALWHGFNLPLLMSAAALGGGVLLYACRKPLFTLSERLPAIEADRVFEAATQRSVAIARRLIALLDDQSLRRYLLALLGFTIVLGGTALWYVPRFTDTVTTTAPDAISALVAALCVAAAFATVRWHRQRLRALLAISVVGLCAVLAFARFSAPDLALTQLTVEVVTLLLMLCTLRFLPQEIPARSGNWRRWRDAIVAALVGLGSAALAFAVMTRPYDSISQFFIEHSVPDGGGRNVVNVILVDFRGFDTLGEIAVLAIAAIGIAALLDGLKLPAQTPVRDSDRHPVIATALINLLTPLALLIAVYIFLRGHNAPGGGFVAGLITAAALLLQYIARGQHTSAMPARLTYQRLAGIGLLLAAAVGAASWLFAHNFLTSTFGHWQVPLLGDIELASAMAFDLGIYLVVVGATLLIMTRLARIGPPAPLRNREKKN